MKYLFVLFLVCSCSKPVTYYLEAGACYVNDYSAIKVISIDEKNNRAVVKDFGQPGNQIRTISSYGASWYSKIDCYSVEPKQ